MTLRALIIGFIGAMFIAGAGYINDRILELENFTSGHLLPVIVLGLLFITLLTLNPLLHRFREKSAFRPAELGLIVIMVSVACSIPGRGLMEQFTQCIVMPYHWNRVTPGWKSKNLLDYVPPKAFVEVNEENYDKVVTGYMMGRGAGNGLEDNLGDKINRVPWGAWKPALATWVPMILLVGLCSVCLGLIVHKQWSEHEFLSYPIADFTASLLEREKNSLFPTVFRNRLFWIGFLLIYAIRLNNGLHRWFPEYLIPVNLSWDLRPFGSLFPSMTRAPYGSQLLRFSVFPLVTAFAFFLSTEVSLTLGVTQICYVIFAIPLVNAGMNLSTQYALGGWNGYMRAGAFVAFALMLLYTGRQYYKETLYKALAVWRRVKPEDSNVWTARILIISLALLTGLLMRLGLELPFAAGLVFLMMLGYLIVSRISAETGLFFIQPRWQPIGIMMALCGVYTMNPTTIMLVSLAGCILCIDQSQGLMPYLVNGLKVGEKIKLRPAKVGGISMGIYALGVILAIAVVLIATYDFGAPLYNWSYQRIPSMPFRAVEDAVLQLQALGDLDIAQSAPWTQRLSRLLPKEYFIPATLIGFLFVIVFSFLRLRLPKWPLHPVMFLVWATYPMATLSSSLLLGFMVKKAAVRFGGTPIVRKMRPLMIGIIAAEIVGALTFMIVGALYYYKTGLKPISYRYFPR